MKNDLRIQKTKNSLYTALETLLQKQGILEIRGNTLAKEAGINPKTFYRHYDSPLHLYYELILLRIAEVFSKPEREGKDIFLLYSDEPNAYLQNSLDWIAKIRKYQPFWNLIFRRDNAPITQGVVALSFPGQETPADDILSRLFQAYCEATELVILRYVAEHPSLPAEHLLKNIAQVNRQYLKEISIYQNHAF